MLQKYYLPTLPHAHINLQKIHNLNHMIAQIVSIIDDLFNTSIQVEQ